MSLKKISQINEEQKLQRETQEEVPNALDLSFEKPKINASVKTITYEEAKANQVSLADLMNSNAQNQPKPDPQNNKDNDKKSLDSVSDSENDNSQNEDSNDEDDSEVEEAIQDQTNQAKESYNKWYVSLSESFYRNYQPKKSRYELDNDDDDYLDPIAEQLDEED